MSDVGSPRRSSAHVVTVTVPGRADCVHVLRAVIGSVGARLDFPYDQIDDLRLATTEVVAQLLEVPPAPDSITLRVTELEHGLEVVASRSAAARTWPPEGIGSTLTSVILRALADEAHFDTTDAGPSIRFVKAIRAS
jgi:hypothetical protein